MRSVHSTASRSFLLFPLSIKFQSVPFPPNFPVYALQFCFCFPLSTNILNVNNNLFITKAESEFFVFVMFQALRAFDIIVHTFPLDSLFSLVFGGQHTVLAVFLPCHLLVLSVLYENPSSLNLPTLEICDSVQEYLCIFIP